MIHINLKEYSKFKKGKKGKIYIHIEYNLLNIIRSYFRIYKKKDEYFGENHHNLLDIFSQIIPE